MACINIDPSKFTTEILDEYIDISLESHRQRIRHLYRRIGFGASFDDINNIPPNTKFAQLVDQLIAGAIATSLPDEFDWSVRSTLPPVYELTTDTGTSYPRTPERMYRDMIANYWINECITESIKSKLLMFWHSHFAIKTDDYFQSYATLQYFKILHKNAFGDFKEMVKKIGRTPMMLFFLSGFDSSGEPDGNYTDGSKEPNENYARELLELFTMGTIDKDGAENYTEDDIEALARVLTGWRIHDDHNSGVIGWDQSEEELAEILDEAKFHFDYKQHDWGTKTLFKDTDDEVSFNSLTDHWKPIIPNVEPQSQDLPEVTVIAAPVEDGTPEEKYVYAGTAEYNQVHDIIFEKKQQEIAYFICKKLYQFYVYADTENENIKGIDAENFDLDSYISSLATAFINNNWSIEIVLKLIFKSQHFYDIGIMGTQIKSHIESAVSLFRSTALQPIINGVGDYEYRLTLLTPDEAGESQEYESDGESINPNYNGGHTSPHPQEDYPEGQPFYYANNGGQVNIMTGEGATLEDVTKGQRYFFNTQVTWGIKRQSGEIGQDLFMPPSVEGWPGHRTWINEYTLVKRQELLSCALTRFSIETQKKFRQMTKSLLDLEHGTASSSYYSDPEEHVRVLWRHFFSVEPEEKEVDGEKIGQIVDALNVYTADLNEGYSININSDSEEMAQRVTNVLEYFVRQPEFNLT